MQSRSLIMKPSQKGLISSQQSPSSRNLGNFASIDSKAGHMMLVNSSNISSRANIRNARNLSLDRADLATISPTFMTTFTSKRPSKVNNHNINMDTLLRRMRNKNRSRKQLNKTVDSTIIS